jgi:hypothetical protein
VVVADEPGDRNGVRVTLDVGDERVVAKSMVASCRGRPGQARLRAVEAGAAGLLAQALEDRHHRSHVPVTEGPHEEFGAVFWLDHAGMHGELEKPTL